MKRLGHYLLSALTPGVRGILAVLTTAYFVSLAGRWTHTFDLSAWLVLQRGEVWQGQLWRLVSYPLLPVGLGDFLSNGLAILFLGGAIERVWSRRELWAYGLLAAAGAGVVRMFLPLAGAPPLTGTAPVVFGLLAAWGFIYGNAPISAGLGGGISVRTTAWLLGIAGAVMMFFAAGPGNTIVIVSGGLLGLFYLWMRSKLLMNAGARTVSTDRISRLEL